MLKFTELQKAHEEKLLFAICTVFKVSTKQQ